tara:strand:- start:143 stop:295 length:153 start_codon:yes stop_codon:yes gene_type:complete
VVKAGLCKSSIAGSIPALASTLEPGQFGSGFDVEKATEKCGEATACEIIH